MSGIEKSKSGGFTLTEILVVSVIVTIVAGVAIPIYSDYVKDQRLETAKNLAQTAAVAANVYMRRTGSAPECDASTCPSVLNLLLPEAGRYEVTVKAADTTLTVKDNQHSEATATVHF
jgi:prepilin-type N-terminal cleavage/methylation domain-containing protein